MVKFYLFLALNLCLHSTTIALPSTLLSFSKSDSIPVNIKDVHSIDAIVKALYNVISGDSAVKRNWDRMRTLFIPEAKLMSTSIRREGTMSYRAMTLEDYIRISGPILEKGFFETEISRKTEQFGNISHVFSTYQSKFKQTDAKPFTRGINSIQLMFDGKRWWVVSVFWTSESPTNPIPAKYLKSKK
jgi:hypothetical protein